MPRLRHHRLFLGLLAFVAVGWAQAYGLHRGFMCDCGGVELLSQVDHCHGPHSSTCHDDAEDHSSPHSHDEEEGEQDDRHDHAAVVDSLLAQHQQDGTLDVAARFHLIETLDLETGSRLPATAVRAVLETPPRRWDLSYEWPRRLAQVIALRV